MRQSSRFSGRLVIACVAVGLVTLPCGVFSQTTATPAPTTQGTQAKQSNPVPFKPEEIEALVAPIALYPDNLLSQVLMASTYPLEVVYATRWVKANPKVKGEDAVKAVAKETWDVSVKSLVAFPQVLEPMNDKLEWTQKLGDAFLADQKAVLDAVQRLRAKAQETGNLKTTEQQKVITEPPSGSTTQTVIRIEPANPQVIYVPTYDPTVVYGGWAYPYYPPYYWSPYYAYYPPGYAFGAGLAWGFGFAMAGAIFGNCNWGGGDVNIDIDRATNIDRNFDRNKVSNGKWNHDASHRQGVAYRDNATREKFGRNVPGADNRADFRGRDGAANRAGVSDRAGAGVGDRGGAGVSDRGGAGVSDRGGAGVGDRGGAGGASVADRGGAGTGSVGGGGGGSFDRGSAGSRDSAFQGVGRGSATQSDISRGRSSMSSGGFSRPSGGGARGGGGGRRR